MAFNLHLVESVYRLITENMEQVYADRPGVRFRGPDGAVVTRLYREYAQDIRRAAGDIAARLGGGEGKRICLIGKNSYHYAVNIMGLMAAGTVQVPLNHNKSWDELRYEIDLVEPDAILWDGGDYPWREQLVAAYGDRLLPMDGYQGAEPAELKEAADTRALSLIMFTSGTTGRSKGVMLHQRGILRAGVVSLGTWDAITGRAKAAGVTEADSFRLSHFTMLPLFHMAAYASLFHWVLTGTATNLCDAHNFYQEMADMPSEAMAVVPVIAQMIQRDLARGRRDRLGPLWILMCSSASFSPDMLLDLSSRGMLIIQNYGMTETSSAGLINQAQDAAHIGAAGRPISCLEYKLDEGELCIRGDCVMLGYYKDPETTAEALDAEGWLHTGDLARVDEEGYYYITGRKKNLIILDSGENVSPEELEHLVGQCPEVKECVVKEKGKKICAVVCCEPDKQEAVQAHITEVNRKLPLYKRMSAVEFTAEPLPRNAAGKLDRR